jgi:hypothetical protein
VEICKMEQAGIDVGQIYAVTKKAAVLGENF